MPLNLDELLQNKEIADDFEIPFRDGGTIRFGDLRTAISTREQRARELDDRRQALETEKQTLEQTLRGLRQPPAEPPAREVPPADDDELPLAAGEYAYDDPYSKGFEKRLVKMLKGVLGQELEGRMAEYKNLPPAIAANSALTLRALARQEFMECGEWPEGWNSTKAFQEAAKKGYIDPETRLPNISRLYDEITAPQREQKRIETAVEKAVADARKKWNDEQAERNRSKFGVVPRGSNARPATAPKQGGRDATQSRQLGDVIRDMEVTDADVQAAATLFGGMNR